MIVGGIASRVAGEVLQGQASQLRVLTPYFVDYALAFYDAGGRAAEPASPVASEPEQRLPPSQQSAAQAGA